MGSSGYDGRSELKCSVRPNPLRQKNLRRSQKRLGDTDTGALVTTLTLFTTKRCFLQRENPPSGLLEKVEPVPCTWAGEDVVRHQGLEGKPGKPSTIRRKLGGFLDSLSV